MTTKDQIRALLIEHPDGLTVPQLMTMLQKADKPLRFAIRSMEDVYIDRWVRGRAGPYSAVWVRVNIPEDAPRPDGKPRATREKELARIRSREHQRRKAAVKRQEHVPQGLTTIRGPWPASVH